jgi:hypothetical protein
MMMYYIVHHGIDMPTGRIATFALLIVFVANGSAAAQNRDTPVRDTIGTRRAFEVEEPQGPPSVNAAVFGQVGSRSQYCDGGTTVGNLGLMLKADVITLGEESSVFLRLSAAGGTLTMLEGGAGMFLNRNFYLSASYANLESPECDGDYGMGPLSWMVKENGVRSTLLIAAGFGRHGFLFEFDLFLYFEKERYTTYYYYSWDSGQTNAEYKPGAYSFRLGYSF